LFSDEKKWTVEEHFNSQNDRIYAASFSEAYSSDEYFVDAQQSPAYVMVWGAISTKSKVALAFLPSEKMTAKKYCDIVLRKHVMSLGTDFFAGKRWQALDIPAGRGAMSKGKTDTRLAGAQCGLLH
jgi:hypothetical protein